MSSFKDLRTGKCAINFLPDSPKAFQVFECTWDDSLENAYEDRSKVGQLEGIEGPYRSFNGVKACNFPNASS